LRVADSLKLAMKPLYCIRLTLQLMQHSRSPTARGDYRNCRGNVPRRPDSINCAGLRQFQQERLMAGACWRL